MLNIKDVPYRRWHNGKLVGVKQGEKVLSLGLREMQAGKAVDTSFKLVEPEIIDGKPVKRGTYETISLTITD